MPNVWGSLVELRRRGGAQLPPERVRAVVEQAWGEGVWQQFSYNGSEALRRSGVPLDHLTLNEWYRPPNRRPSGGALYTQHGAGLAVDVGTRDVDAEAREKLRQAFVDQGFWVEPLSKTPGHVHAQFVNLTKPKANERLQKIYRALGSLGLGFPEITAR